MGFGSKVAAYYLAMVCLAAQTDLTPAFLYQATANPEKRPTNDDFSDRVALPTSHFVTISSLFSGATREPDEPAIPNATLWWEWTAPYSGTFLFETFGNQLSPGIEVFSGAELSKLTRVAPQIPSHSANHAGVQAVEGETLFIRVNAREGSRGTVTLRIQRGPENDNFAAATRLSGDNFIINSFAQGATFEEGEDIFRNDLTASVWWVWLAHTSGFYIVEARLSHAPMALAAYRGDSLRELSLISKVIKESNPFLAKVGVFAEPGERIIIKAASQFDVASAVQLRIWKAPDHDDFANAAFVAEDFVSGNTYGATSQIEEPDFGSFIALGQSVWYRWQPKLASGYEVELTGGEGENILSIYEGSSLDSLNLVRRINSPAGEWSGASVLADPLKTYFIAINALFPGGDSFNFSMSPGPSNDAFAGRHTLEGSSFDLHATTAGATREPAEPPHDPSLPARTLWWEWTAPRAGGFRVEVATADLPPWLIVYKGDRLTNLTVVPSDRIFTESGEPYVTSTTFRASADEKYIFLLYDSKQIDFELRLRPGPVNDEFEAASDLPLGIEFKTSSAAGATFQPGESAQNPQSGSVWHKFVAPAEGSYVLLSSGAPATIYRGSVVSELAMVDAISPPGFPPARLFRAAAGETFFISVVLEFSTSYSLRILPGASNDDFARRILLSGETTLQNPAWCTFEAGEPNAPTNMNGGTVWWRWAPTWPSLYRIQTIVAANESSLAVYKGDTLTDLVLVAFSETTTMTNRLEFLAEANTEYSIAVAQKPWFNSALKLQIASARPQDIPSAPRLIINAGSPSILTLPLDDNFNTIIESSTDLTGWTAFTNYGPSSLNFQELELPAPTNDTPQFFRALITP